MTTTSCRNILEGKHLPKKELHWEKKVESGLYVNLVLCSKVHNLNNQKKKETTLPNPGVSEGLQERAMH